MIEREESEIEIFNFQMTNKMLHTLRNKLQLKYNNLRNQLLLSTNKKHKIKQNKKQIRNKAMQKQIKTKHYQEQNTPPKKRKKEKLN